MDKRQEHVRDGRTQRKTKRRQTRQSASSSNSDGGNPHAGANDGNVLPDVHDAAGGDADGHDDADVAGAAGGDQGGNDQDGERSDISVHDVPDP